MLLETGSINMKKVKTETLIIIAIFFFGLIPLLWFIPNHLITGGDLDFPIFPKTRFIERLFVWNPIIRGGTNEAHNFTTLFFTGVEAFFSFFSPNPIVVEKLSFIFWYTLMGFSMLFTTNLLFGKKRFLVKIFAIVFWLFNFYQVYAWEIFRLDEIAALVALPPILALYIQGLQEKIPLKKVILWLIPFSVVASSIATNPTVALPLPSAFIIFFAIALTFKKTNFWKGLKFSSLFAAIIILLNFYWILPFAQKVKSEQLANSDAKDTIYKADTMLEWTTANNNLLNVTRSYGDVFLHSGYKDDPYLPFFEEYKKSRHLEALSFMLPIFAFLGLALVETPLVLFFGILAIFAILFSQGMHAPFGPFYMFLRSHLPIFWTIRAPWQKFSILTTFSLTILASLFLEKMSGKILQLKGNKFFSSLPSRSAYRNKILFLIVVTPLILQVYYMKGFIKGGMFPRPGEQKYLPPYHQKIPDYLFQTFDWLNSQKEDFKILMLPEDITNVYDWGYGAPKDITFNYSKHPILFSQYGQGSYTPHAIDTKINQIYKAIYEERAEKTLQLAKELGVKYIIQRNDFVFDFYGDTDSPQFIKEKLQKIGGLELTKSFGKWDIYQIESNIAPLFHIGNNIPLEYKRINPTKYILNLPKSDSGYELIFTHNFDKSWQARLEGEALQHKTSVDYANGWQIPKEGGKIVIEYTQQKFFYFGLIVTVGSLAGLMFWLWKNKQKEN